MCSDLHKRVRRDATRCARVRRVRNAAHLRDGVHARIPARISTTCAAMCRTLHASCQSSGARRAGDAHVC
jgi:hypothetical protein